MSVVDHPRIIWFAIWRAHSFARACVAFTASGGGPQTPASVARLLSRDVLEFGARQRISNACNRNATGVGHDEARSGKVADSHTFARASVRYNACWAARMQTSRVAGFCVAVCISIVSVEAQSRPAELADAGWKALRDENPGRAAALFAEALELLPDNPSLLLGAGAAAHARGKERQAMASLQRALQIEPRLTQASALLGSIAFDEGDSELAIQTYEQALKYAPDNDRLKRQLAIWRRETRVHETFSDRTYGRFRVLFEGREEQSLAMQATAVLDSAFYKIGRALGEFPPNTIVTVLYTEQQFRDITRAPAWSGGQYDGRIRIPVAGAANNPQLFERVLVHELSHAIVANIAPHAVPVWLDEGLAQHFEGADPDAARRRLSAGGRFIPLSQLEHSFGRLGAADAQVAYDESLLAVGVLLDRPGFSWVRLLHRLRDGATFKDAIANSGYTYEDFEAGWRR